MNRRPRLLLIDDEPALARFLADAARLAGYDPVIAEDHHRFRALYRDLPPDMVAIDLGMPGMDGVELLRFLAEEKADQPVLIVSGFDNRILESAQRLGTELGLNMAGTLSKPARLDEVEHLLGEVRERLVA
ncbi:response regulator [Sphingomicrobium nitratireducens]|uniref:response regulator n=1 Tax=Sphingomicrobium nitratireducens TaxID=2964666 RepID=UPI002240CFDB|nr:response regulator [Sphingomicrobium nitratireducens]